MSVHGQERDDGFTPQEGEVADHITAAVAAFAKLERQHPDEARDFCDSIHRLQDLMAMRIVRRCYPKGWTNTAASPEGSPLAGLFQKTEPGT